MKNALLPGLGGPMGRHAKPSGLWFNPLPWVILVASVLFVVLALRQVPCIQTDATNSVDGFIRLCYSDIPLMWTGQEFGLGKPPFGGESMLFSPVLGVLMLAAVKVSGWLGAVIQPDADVQLQLDGAQIFFAVNAVLLFIFFLAWVVSMTLMGRESRGRFRSWDGMLIAASPVVLASGLIHWDLLPIGLSAIGLYQFSRRRLIESGIVLGLAAAAGTMPMVIVVAVAVTIGLRGRVIQVVKFGLPAVVTWFVIHLPLLLRDWKSVMAFYQGQISGEAAYGSPWFLLQVTGVNLRYAGYLGLMLLLMAMVATISWLYGKKIRPRVGTLVAIFVFLTCLLGAAFSPQCCSLWFWPGLSVSNTSSSRQCRSRTGSPSGATSPGISPLPRTDRRTCTSSQSHSASSSTCGSSSCSTATWLGRDETPCGHPTSATRWVVSWWTTKNLHASKTLS